MMLKCGGIRIFLPWHRVCVGLSIVANLNMLDVFVEGVGINKDVVYVYDDPTVEHVSKDIIDGGLKD